MKWFLQRLAEPSSHVGLASAIMHGSALGTGSIETGYGITGLILSMLAVLFPEGLSQQLSGTSPYKK